MARFLLSPQAQKSLVQILVYTLENYGLSQKNQYLMMLRDRMSAAAGNPNQGKERSDIKEGYYSIKAGKHCIYYRVRDTHIEIIDVLHQSMEPRWHL